MNFDFEISNISLTENCVVGSGNGGANLCHSRVGIGSACSRCEIGDLGVFCHLLSRDVAIIQLITSCYKTSMTGRVITFYAKSLTTSTSTMRCFIEVCSL